MSDKKVEQPFPEQRQGYRIEHYKGKVVAVITFRPQYVILENKGKAEKVCNTKEEMKRYINRYYGGNSDLSKV